MTDNQFAFIVHPLNLEDIFRKLPMLRSFPAPLVKGLMRRLPPFRVSEITGVSTPLAQTQGYFIGLPLLPDQMLEMPEKKVYRKIVAAGRTASRLGVKIVGLGAMTSVVGDAGISVARSLDIPVTTGNSYTVATALEGARKAASIMGINLESAEVVVLGGTGSIGRVCAQILARDVRFLTLVARRESLLEELAHQILENTGLSVRITTDVKKAISRADLLIAVSGAAESLIAPEDLKSGAVVCDVARPRDVSRRVAEERDDVLVIEGGVVEVPGDVEFNFHFGFPPKTAYACMAETMVLALEERFESFSLGRSLTVDQVDEISQLAQKHGFRLAGFRSFERSLGEEEIARIRENSRVNKFNRAGVQS